MLNLKTLNIKKKKSIFKNVGGDEHPPYDPLLIKRRGLRRTVGSLRREPRFP
jgi:hypothetical protein